MSEAARLLLAVLQLLAHGTVTEGAVVTGAWAWQPSGLLGILSNCCDAANQLWLHIHCAADLPHVAQLCEGPASPELVGRFAHAALQTALALHPHAGKRVLHPTMHTAIRPRACLRVPQTPLPHPLQAIPTALWISIIGLFRSVT